MPLPAPLETVTVTGTWLSPITGSGLVGTVELTPINQVTSPAGDVLLTTEPNTQTLSSGTATWTGVLFSDSTGISSTVLYRLKVTGTGFSDERRIQLLKAAAVGGVINLADVVPTVSGPPATTYVLAANVGQTGGPAGPLDASGKIPTAQIPAQGGTPDATSTVKGVLKLTNDLGGTADLPTVPGLTGKQPLDADLTAIAALTPANDDILQRKAGAWTNRTIDQLTTDLALAITDVTGLQAALDAKIAAGLADTKGDLIVATAADTVARLPVGSTGQVLTVDAAQSSGVKWAPASIGQSYPLQEGYGYHSASIHPDGAKSGAAFAGWHTRIWVPADQAITKAGIFITTAAVGTATLTAFAVYTDDGQTQLGATAHDNALFLSTGLRSANLTSSIPAQAAGRFVQVLVTSNYNTSGPNAAFAEAGSNDAAYNAGTGIRTAFHNALTSFPATFNPTTGTGLSGWTPSTFLPIILIG